MTSTPAATSTPATVVFAADGRTGGGKEAGDTRRACRNEPDDDAVGPAQDCPPRRGMAPSDRSRCGTEPISAKGGPGPRPDPLSGAPASQAPTPVETHRAHG